MNDLTGKQTVQALRAVPASIPADMLWDESNQTFRWADGEKVKVEEVGSWWERRGEFPRWEDSVAAKINDAPPKPAFVKPIEEIGVEENHRVHETITSDQMRQHALLEQLDAAITAKQDALQDLGDKRAILSDQIDIGHAALGELLRQRAEVLDRIDLYGKMLHDTQMKQLRRAHAL